MTDKISGPKYIYADYDYEIGDGSCGLHEEEKRANEPAQRYILEQWLKGNGKVIVDIETLKWWRELVDLNPNDLKPRLDGKIKAAQEDQ